MVGGPAQIHTLVIPKHHSPQGSPRPHLTPQGSLLTPAKSQAPEEGVQGCHMLGTPILSGLISCLLLQLLWTPTNSSFFELTKWAISSPSARSLTPLRETGSVSSHPPAVPHRVESVCKSKVKSESAMPLPSVPWNECPGSPQLPQGSPRTLVHSAMEKPTLAHVEMAWRGPETIQRERKRSAPSCSSSSFWLPKTEPPPKPFPDS